jgi:hypothetical protein
MNDSEYFERALMSYRELSNDLREFDELEHTLQQWILHKAQRLKEEIEREKRGS